MTDRSTNDGSTTDGSTAASIREICSRALGGLQMLVPQRFRRDRPIVPIVRLTGIVGFSTPLRPGLTLASVARTFDRAFAIGHAAASTHCTSIPGDALRASWRARSGDAFCSALNGGFIKT